MGKIEPMSDGELAEVRKYLCPPGHHAILTTTTGDMSVHRLLARLDAAEAEASQLRIIREELDGQRQGQSLIFDPLNIRQSIRDLQAVVEKLDKTDDGVPTPPGEQVWVRDVVFGVMQEPFHPDRHGSTKGPSRVRCWSTKEAALAATSAGDTDGK